MHLEKGTMRYLIIIIFFSLVFVAKVSADPPPVSPNQPSTDQFTIPGYGNLDKYNPVSAALRQTGITRWSVSYRAGCNGEAAFDGMVAAMVNSNETFGTLWVFDPINPQLRILVTCGTEFASYCGGGVVIACLGNGFPYVLDTQVSSTLTTFFALSQIAIWLHELVGHAQSTWDEQYCKQAGTPVGCTGQFAPAPNWVDIMNTGPLSRHLLGQTEIDRWARTQGVRSQECWASQFDDGNRYFWYGVSDVKATRVAVMAYDPTTGIGRWTGYQIPTTNGISGWLFNDFGIQPNEIVVLNPENAASTRVGRADRACIIV